MTDTKLAAEVVKLKQEMAELRATIERIDKAVSSLLKDHDGNYSPTLKPPPQERTRELPDWYKRMVAW